jgi:hypothetical protein
MGAPQEAKYVERWPNTTSAWAGWSRFDNPVDSYSGVHSLLSAPAVYWGLLPATRLASRKILIQQNIKKRTGPALWLLCGRTLLSPRPVSSDPEMAAASLPDPARPPSPCTRRLFYMISRLNSRNNIKLPENKQDNAFEFVWTFSIILYIMEAVLFHGRLRDGGRIQLQ